MNEYTAGQPRDLRDQISEVLADAANFIDETPPFVGDIPDVYRRAAMMIVEELKDDYVDIVWPMTDINGNPLSTKQMELPNSGLCRAKESVSYKRYDGQHDVYKGRYNVAGCDHLLVESEFLARFDIVEPQDAPAPTAET